jgi:hypothetical protein
LPGTDAAPGDGQKTAGQEGFFVHLGASHLAPDPGRKRAHRRIIPAGAKEFNDGSQQGQGSGMEFGRIYCGTAADLC